MDQTNANLYIIDLSKFNMEPESWWFFFSKGPFSAYLTSPDFCFDFNAFPCIGLSICLFKINFHFLP